MNIKNVELTRSKLLGFRLSQTGSKVIGGKAGGKAGSYGHGAGGKAGYKPGYKPA